MYSLRFSELAAAADGGHGVGHDIFLAGDRRVRRRGADVAKSPERPLQYGSEGGYSANMNAAKNQFSLNRGVSSK
jgi:hypothetical protein